MARYQELLFALVQEDLQTPYVLACAGSAKALARDLLPWAEQCCDSDGLQNRLVKLIEKAAAEYDGEQRVEVFVPDDDEEDKSGMSFLLQVGLPDGPGCS